MCSLSSLLPSLPYVADHADQSLPPSLPPSLPFAGDVEDFDVHLQHDHVILLVTREGGREGGDRKSTRLNSSHEGSSPISRMPSSA